MSGKERAYAKSWLPPGMTPRHFHGAAYCVAKPAVLCVVIATPPDNPHANVAQIVYSDGLIHNPSLGEWVTLVYATSRTSSRWFVLPYVRSQR